MLKPGLRAVVINAPPGYVEQLGLPVDSELPSKPKQDLDFVQVFAKNGWELDQVLLDILKALKFDGLLWVSYSKGSSGVKTDLNRDILWKKLGDFHLAGIAMVSVDDVWSAMRFRPREKVGK